MALTYIPRFGTVPGDDNTCRVLQNSYAEPAYAATIALTPNAAYTYYNFAALTGAATVNLTTTNCKVNDEIVMLFKNDGTTRTVTLGTGMSVSASTIAVTAAKFSSITFIYNGTTFVEIGRSVGV